MEAETASGDAECASWYQGLHNHRIAPRFKLGANCSENEPTVFVPELPVPLTMELSHLYSAAAYMERHANDMVDVCSRLAKLEKRLEDKELGGIVRMLCVLQVRAHAIYYGLDSARHDLPLSPSVEKISTSASARPTATPPAQTVLAEQKPLSTAVPKPQHSPNSVAIRDTSTPTAPPSTRVASTTAKNFNNLDRFLASGSFPSSALTKQSTVGGTTHTPPLKGKHLLRQNSLPVSFRKYAASRQLLPPFASILEETTVRLELQDGTETL